MAALQFEPAGLSFLLLGNQFVSVEDGKGWQMAALLPCVRLLTLAAGLKNWNSFPSWLSQRHLYELFSGEGKLVLQWKSIRKM